MSRPANEHDSPITVSPESTETGSTTSEVVAQPTGRVEGSASSAAQYRRSLLDDFSAVEPGDDKKKMEAEINRLEQLQQTLEHDRDQLSAVLKERDKILVEHDYRLSQDIELESLRRRSKKLAELEVAMEEKVAMEAELSCLLKHKVHECVSLQQTNQSLMDEVVTLKHKMDDDKKRRSSGGACTNSGCVERQRELESARVTVQTLQNDNRALLRELEEQCTQSGSAELERAYQAELEQKTAAMTDLRQQYDNARQSWEADRAKMTCTISELNRTLDQQTANDRSAWAAERQQIDAQMAQWNEVKCKLLPNSNQNDRSAGLSPASLMRVIHERIEALLKAETELDLMKESKQMGSPKAPERAQHIPQPTPQTKPTSTWSIISPTDAQLSPPAPLVPPISILHNSDQPTNLSRNSAPSIHSNISSSRSSHRSPTFHVEQHSDHGSSAGEEDGERSIAGSAASITLTSSTQGSHHTANSQPGDSSFMQHLNLNGSFSNTSFDASLLDLHIDKLIQRKINERLSAGTTGTTSNSSNINSGTASTISTYASLTSIPDQLSSVERERAGILKERVGGVMRSSISPPRLPSRTANTASPPKRVQITTHTHPHNPHTTTSSLAASRHSSSSNTSHTHHSTGGISPSTSTRRSETPQPRGSSRERNTTPSRGGSAPMNSQTTTKRKIVSGSQTSRGGVTHAFGRTTSRTARLPPTITQPQTTSSTPDDTTTTMTTIIEHHENHQTTYEPLKRCETPSHLHAPIYHSKPPMSTVATGRPAAPVLARRTSASSHKPSDARSGRPTVKDKDDKAKESSRVRSRSAPQYGDPTNPKSTSASPVPPPPSSASVTKSRSALRAPSHQRAMTMINTSK